MNPMNPTNKDDEKDQPLDDDDQDESTPEFKRHGKPIHDSRDQQQPMTPPESDKGLPRAPQTTAHRSNKTPPGHHWVKALVPASLYHRLRACAAMSETSMPAFFLATLANAVPLAPATNPQSPPSGAGDGTDPDPDTAPSTAAPTPAAPDDHPTPAPALQAPEGGDPHA